MGETDSLLFDSCFGLIALCYTGLLEYSLVSVVKNTAEFWGANWI